MNKYDLKEGFAARLGKAMDDSGMSTRETAQKCGVGATTMTAYMNANNANLPTLAVFTELCEVLNVTADYLLFGKER